MRDPYLLLITSIICSPNKPLKFYMDAAKISRGTFFKAKAHLEALGVVSLTDCKHLVVDVEKGQRFVEEAYPGLPIELGAMPRSPTGSRNRTPAENKQNSVAG